MQLRLGRQFQFFCYVSAEKIVRLRPDLRSSVPSAAKNLPLDPCHPWLSVVRFSGNSGNFGDFGNLGNLLASHQ
jgi:hypothetical protein